jgi:hypothetical protein
VAVRTSIQIAAQYDKSHAETGTATRTMDIPAISVADVATSTPFLMVVIKRVYFPISSQAFYLIGRPSARVLILT